MHVNSTAAEPDECAGAMLEGLPPVMWFIRREMRRRRTRGLSVPQFRALALLDRFPAASLLLVAEHLGSSQPSASRLIAGLVSRGFVTRKECAEDRRQASLILTKSGRSVLAKAREATQQAVAGEISNLNDAERETVAEAMRLLHHVFSSEATSS